MAENQTPAPTAGRIVHYHLKDGQDRPAQVVCVWSETCVNLVVFLDGSNDRGRIPNGDPPLVVVQWTDGQGVTHQSEQFPLTYWATSVVHGDGPSQWSWPPRV